jgi:cell fate regulator YaaT (PSP1 superfamily)
MSEDRTGKDNSYMPRAWGAGSRERRSCDDENGKSEGTGPDRPAEPPEDAAAPESPSVGTGPSIASEPAPVSAPPEQLPGNEQEARISVWREWSTPEEILKGGEGSAPGASRGVPAGRRSEAVRVTLVGVRFGYACKIYHFDCGDMGLERDDRVIVKTEKGVGLGVVALPPFERELEPPQLEGLRKVVRKAVRSDFDQKRRCKEREDQAYAFCMERIDALGLPMKLVGVEVYFDSSKYVFYFTSEGRVDFRDLVKQLVARFPVRIEMRQIGVRHEAKMVGGIACCGQELCCSRFLTDFRPVSVKMAKTQNLSLNPTKISGVCGRLMCCLAYEHEVYDEFKKGLPRVGKAVKTIRGDGVVVKHDPLSQTISVRLDAETVIDVGRAELILTIGGPPCAEEPEANGSLEGLSDDDAELLQEEDSPGSSMEDE